MTDGNALSTSGRPLSEAQRDGRACIYCDGEDGPMVPVPVAAPGGVGTVQLFAHQSCRNELAVGFLEAAGGLTTKQRSTLAYIDGYLLERGSEVRARLHEAFPFLDMLDDPKARRDA